MQFKTHIIEILILVPIIIILVNSLFINPAIGKYDNGDFGKLSLYYGGLSNLSIIIIKCMTGLYICTILYLHLLYF
jgi:hypothetical protein